MKVSEIPFDDGQFRQAVLDTGREQAEDIVELRARKKGIAATGGIEYLTNLKLLDLTRNQIQAIDLSRNPLLENVFLGNNRIEVLDLSANKNLRMVELFMNELGTLDVSQNPVLESLCLNANELESIDLSHNRELEELLINDNSLVSLDLPANGNLQVLEARNNRLSAEQKAALTARGPWGELKL
jgi:Leucine-rich repeat (LRR) protein